MQLYHVTTEGALGSIMADGIDPAYARTARQEVWMVEPIRLFWAIMHVARRHNAGLEQVVALRVNLPASILRKRAEGVYTTGTVIPTSRIQAITNLALQSRRAKP